MSGDAERGKTPLTEKQRAALEAVGVSVALSAGAGCGKTRVLTERYLRHLEGPDRLPLRSIVALTFTEKAARELRERVRHACRDRLALGEEPAYWRPVLRNLEAAPIGTFHSFCGTLLRRFPIEAGVEPGFAVLEEAIAPSLRHDALTRVFREWLAKGDDDLKTLAVEYGLSAVRQAIADLIADRGGHDYRAWGSRDVEEILDAWRSAWESRGRREVIRGVVERAKPLLDVFARQACSHRVMNERIAFLREHLPSLPFSAAPADLLREIRERAKVQGGGSKDDWDSPQAFEAVKQGLEKLRKAIDRGMERLEVSDGDEASWQAASQAVRFARLAADAIEAFEVAKRGRGTLDFDDLLLKTRDLLRDGPPSVREAIGGEIGVILVDEFQDTDPVQAEILELLAGPGLCEGRVFLVGDLKQSIYRFRGARPDLFHHYRNRFPDAGRLDLTENFRSAPGIIAFVNALFADEFPGEEHRLDPRSSGFAPNDGPCVDFVWAHEPGSADARGTISVGRRRLDEARWLARLLAAQLASGWPIWDEKERRVRDAHAGDVVFLLRSLNDAAAYENALVAEGLDYYVVGGSAFFAQQEILDLINLLTAIEDPLDEVALAGVLRSPFFGVSDEGLYWLATTSAGGLPSDLGRYDRIQNLSKRDRSRAGRAQDLLTRWRSLKDRIPIAELLDRALDESGYEAALLGEHLGARKRANCRKLVRLARRFDAQGGLTLADFVARLRADLRKPPREEQAATTDEEGQAVRIMSIHQAKGLEFPIVVVPDLDREPPQMRGRVAFHPELGMVVNPSDDEADPADEGTGGKSLGWVCFREIEKAEEEMEAIRLLYVATTRAREALILSAGVGLHEEPRSPALKLIASQFHRACGDCTVDLPRERDRPRVRVISECPPSLNEGVSRRSRPRVLLSARQIEKATPSSEPAEPPRPPRPRRIDLDAALELSPRHARLDTLIRRILADPEAIHPNQLDAVAAKAMRAVVPAATRDLVDGAKTALAGWLAGPHARQLRQAPGILHAVPWRIALPGSGTDPLVVRGRLDFAFPEPDGGWCLIALALDSASAARGRLRLLLSSRAPGVGHVARGWLVRLADDGGYRIQGEESFDDATIDRALEAVIREDVAR
jgi:ATP-dependent helicase/nuclease subunit A